MKTTPPKPAGFHDDWWKLRWMVVFVLVLTAGYWWLTARILLPDPLPADGSALVSTNNTASGLRGQFGDMFGGLNALFSGLAFAGVVYALLLQRRDLQQQHDGLQLQREAFEEQVKLAAETASLQALVAQLEQWQRMQNAPNLAGETREKLLAETATLVDELCHQREQLNRRLTKMQMAAQESV
ncbi:MAG TPA: hypothetical protein PLX89_11895 [Verrucomicrobiota bacterium]|nr:hypothetical protein [Verrucomicrobiales bacterium]HRI13694.1 hypothetical protein [Verrucomicrobiota bacterium]